MTKIMTGIVFDLLKEDKIKLSDELSEKAWRTAFHPCKFHYAQ